MCHIYIKIDLKNHLFFGFLKSHRLYFKISLIYNYTNYSCNSKKNNQNIFIFIDTNQFLILIEFF